MREERSRGRLTPGRPELQEEAPQDSRVGGERGGEEGPPGWALDLDRGDPIPFDGEAQVIAEIRAVGVDDVLENDGSFCCGFRCR